jgi:hypothetical protein
MSKVLVVKIKAIQDASYNVPSIKITKLYHVVSYYKRRIFVKNSLFG